MKSICANGADLTSSRFTHEMTKQITVATTILTDTSTAASEIDRVLQKMIHESRPVYIGVPVDLSHFVISGAGLETPLNIVLPTDDKTTTTKTIAEIRGLLEKASTPIIIIDGCRFTIIQISSTSYRLLG